MKYLFVKLHRDITKMWLQFFAVFMMSVLAITIYSGMEGVWYGLSCEVDQYYDETNIADIWVNGTMITEDMISDIENLDDVKMVSQSMTTTVRIKTNNNEKPDLKLVSTQENELFNPIIRDGEEYDNSSEDGIWVDEVICAERELKIGDKITVKYGEAEKEFEIKGTILDSEFIYYTGSITDTVPNHALHGYGMISPIAAESFYGAYVCNELRMDVEDDCDCIKLQDDVEDILGDTYLNFSVKDDISSVSQITKEINQMQNMANLFSAVFVVLAILCMYSTMSRLVSNQTIQIGTMKAMGFSNWRIRLHYMSYGFFVSLIGCFIGIFFGKTLVSKGVMRVKKATLTLPEWKVALSYRTYIIIIAIVLVCLIATVIAAQKGLSKLPAETMRDASVRRSKIIKLSNKLDYKSKWMIRDNMQNIVRWVMSIIGVAGSMILMMAGLGFRDSINYSNDYVYDKQYTYAYKVVLNSQYTPEAYDEFVGKLEGEYQTVFEYNIDMCHMDSSEKERRTISVIGDGEFIHLETIDNEKLELKKNTVAISNKIASVLDVKEGDEIKIRILGTKEFEKVKITDVVIAPSPQGLFVSKEYWEENLNKTYAPSSFLLESEKDYDAVKDLEIVKETSTIDDQFASMQVMTKSVMTIIYLMIVASILLGCIIIYNLGMLSYIERFRDYATMKVLGFYQREIRSIIIRDSMITTMIGWLIGIPCGYKFLSFYIGIVQFKTFEWVPTLSKISLIIASIVVIACSAIVNIIVAHKVTKISMVEALKSVE